MPGILIRQVLAPKSTNLTKSVCFYSVLDPREGWWPGKRWQWRKSKNGQCRWTSGMWSHWHCPVNNLHEHDAAALEATFPPEHLEDQHSYLMWQFILLHYSVAFYSLTSQESRWAILYPVCSLQQLCVWVYMSITFGPKELVTHN